MPENPNAFSDDLFDFLQSLIPVRDILDIIDNYTVDSSAANYGVFVPTIARGAFPIHFIMPDIDPLILIRFQIIHDVAIGEMLPFYLNYNRYNRDSVIFVNNERTPILDEHKFVYIATEIPYLSKFYPEVIKVYQRSAQPFRFPNAECVDLFDFIVTKPRIPLPSHDKLRFHMVDFCSQSYLMCRARGHVASFEQGVIFPKEVRAIVLGRVSDQTLPVLANLDIHCTPYHKITGYMTATMFGQFCQMMDGKEDLGRHISRISDWLPGTGGMPECSAHSCTNSKFHANLCFVHCLAFLHVLNATVELSDTSDRTYHSNCRHQYEHFITNAPGVIQRQGYRTPQVQALATTYEDRIDGNVAEPGIDLTGMPHEDEGTHWGHIPLHSTPSAHTRRDREFAKTYLEEDITDIRSALLSELQYQNEQEQSEESEANEAKEENGEEKETDEKRKPAAAREPLADFEEGEPAYGMCDQKYLTAAYDEIRDIEPQERSNSDESAGRASSYPTSFKSFTRLKNADEDPLTTTRMLIHIGCTSEADLYNVFLSLLHIPRRLRPFYIPIIDLDFSMLGNLIYYQVQCLLNNYMDLYGIRFGIRSYWNLNISGIYGNRIAPKQSIYWNFSRDTTVVDGRVYLCPALARREAMISTL